MNPLSEQEKKAIVKSVLAVIFTNGNFTAWKKDVISIMQQNFGIADQLVDQAENMSVDEQIRLLETLKKEQKEKLRNFLGELVVGYHPYISDDRIYRIICGFMHVSPFLKRKKSKHRHTRFIRTGEGAES
ncbi:MAG TPA: hypothetical protein VE912_21975 [Bacteroidales bacterium]|nr:hypothetical protein [Bacteroidales bacterium]